MPTTTASSREATEQPRSSAHQLAREIPVLVVLAVVIAYCIKTFLAQAFFIPSGSMIPQLQIGDRVVVSKLSYHLHDPHRGDILVFDSPYPKPPDHTSLPGKVVRGILESVGIRQPSTEEYIKRVIGLPGETVDAKNGHIVISGRELEEPYLPPGTTTDMPRGPVHVPAGHLFVMGDNRGNSQDSRFFGPIRKSTVVGRAIARIWPPLRAAYL